MMNDGSVLAPTSERHEVVGVGGGGQRRQKAEGRRREGGKARRREAGGGVNEEGRKEYSLRNTLPHSPLSL